MSTEKQIIDQILAQKQIAVAGVSQNPRKFGNIVYKHLKQNGYTVFAVNPNRENIGDDRCYSDILSLPEEVKAIVTVTKPEVTKKIVEDAIARHIGMIWMQQGSESREAIAMAKDAGILVMQNRCIMMHAEPVKSVHSFHRAIMKLFGRYPK
jgi:uncharacterized protein